ncbi:MAG: CinA family nicotinamide mononucleotide deamidase-related protein [Bacilli bacterium]
MKAMILNIGEEVLQGKVINTNASFLSLELRKIGIETDKIIVVGDRQQDIVEQINNFISCDLDILITTGGLGPTHDDLTKEVLASCLNLEMEINKQARDLLNDYFGKDMAPCNLKQAYFPKEAILIENPLGTADGAILEKNHKIYIILVGPPHEMNPMVINSVIPFLKNKTGDFLLSKDYIVMGNGESNFEEILNPLFRKYSQVMISPYASLGKIRYQIVSSKQNKLYFDEINNEFRKIMKDFIISENNEEIEEVVVSLLQKKQFIITFGESCTGGMLASKIINVPNASRILKESFIVYSNEAKTKYLHVKPQILQQFGAVSDQTIEAMLDGLDYETKANVCVAVSGIAGPSGGSDEKPVGLVHYGIDINGKRWIEHKHFKGNREMVRQRATLFILFRLWQLLK